MVKFIEILKSQKETDRPTNWAELEDHVQRVYQRLLALEGEEVLVARDASIRGKTGLDHQIDVYYEFELTGLRHRVAIECKNITRPLDKDRVGAFVAKISDCPGVRGCIVAAHGYQSGAKKFAEDNGITALTFDDLPSLGKLLGMELELVVIPKETTIGQPFWTVYELETGAPAGHIEGNQLYGVLFMSKGQAQAYFNHRKYDSKWAVRGLSQENFRAYILTVDAMGGGFLLGDVIQYEDGTMALGGHEIKRSILVSEFYHGSGQIPAEPMVAPSVLRQKAKWR